MHKISVSIVYATKEQQWIKELAMQRGQSVGDLVEESSFLNEITALSGCSMGSIRLGIYSKKVDLDTLLEEGDRVEIYRPLTADPKEVRRQLALLGKTMGNKQP